MKKGVSNIIVIVLITLVAFIAISLTWTFVSHLLLKSEIHTQADISFLNSRIAIVQSSLVIDGRDLSFFVERAPDGEEIDGFLIVLSDEGGFSETIEKYSSRRLEEFERVRVEIFGSEYGLSEVASIAVYGIIHSDELNENIISSQPLTTVVVDKNTVTGAGSGTSGSGGSGGSSNGETPSPGDLQEYSHLPLAASWNTGSNDFAEGYDLVWQTNQILNGHHILPSISISTPLYSTPSAKWINRTLQGMAVVSDLSLPLVIISTQWEAQFYNQEALFTPGADYGFLTLPNATNPNFVHVNGSVLKKVSPFGDLDSWHSLGVLWTANNSYLSLLQQEYPSLTNITFFSNNEANKIRHYELYNESRFVSTHGSSTNVTFQKTVLGDAWVSHYNELFAGMREGLSSQWSNAAQFGAYTGTTQFMFRWSGWTDYDPLSSTTSQRLSVIPSIWDRISPEFYVHSDTSFDELRNGYSVSIGMMQVVEQKKWILEENPDLTFEISTWINPLQETNNPQFNVSLYEGMVQYVMWLLKPDVVRHYSDWNRPIEDDLKYYSQVIDSVDRVHEQEILAIFWEEGTLVLNPNRLHPFHSALDAAPLRFQNRSMWYALDTTLDPADFPDQPTHQQFLDAQFEVWTIAQVKGDAPNREWLVYSYSTNVAQQNFNVTLPDFGQITLNATVDGMFYLVNETDSSVSYLGF